MTEQNTRALPVNAELCPATSRATKKAAALEHAEQYAIQARQEILDDDRAFFSRYPDREFRLRRTHHSELSGRPPSGWQAYSILHRHDVGQSWWHDKFPAPINFDCSIDDAGIRNLLVRIYAEKASK